jgi:diguanylate cyclase
VQVRGLATARQEARTDELTGLGNRRLLYERVESALTSRLWAEQVCLVLVDLDRFKDVNDSLGHQVGDQLLRAVGARLAHVLGPGDVIARLGGDEFAVLVGPSGGLQRAQATAERMRASLYLPFLVDGMTLHVGASMGIAAAPHAAGSRTDLLRQADVAMYAAKRLRHGIAVYEPSRDINSRERLQVATDLRRALDDDEFIVHYQPKCTMDGRVTGVEALCRWQHPRHGLLAPESFISLAEEHHLTPALTRRILRAALADCRSWRRAGLAATVSVNLSPSTLLDPGLLDDVGNALADAGLPADVLVLEITETTVMADPPRGRGVLTALHALGVRLSVDDYGTGHCSLAYLRHLPVEELKLDRSFVANVVGDKRDAAIVRSTIELAHALGMIMVAEGVEDAASAELLARMGCDLAQGYYFSRPLPLPELLAWVSLPSGPPAWSRQRHAVSAGSVPEL